MPYGVSNFYQFDEYLSNLGLLYHDLQVHSKLKVGITIMCATPSEIPKNDLHKEIFAVTTMTL